MLIDSKLQGFKSFISENRLNNGGIKTTIDQSAVAASNNSDVQLNLQDDDSENSYTKSKKKKKDKGKSQTDDSLLNQKPKKSDAELKAYNMKLLNLL